MTGVPNVKSFYHDHNYPQWLKHKVQKFSPQDYLGDMAEEVPTFFKRKNRNGKIVNAFEEDTWFKIRTRNAGQSEAGALLKVEPGLVKNSQYVSVAWSGVQNATAKDMIVLYCPENAEDNDYIDYFNADVSSTYMQGNGEYSVQLTNLRTNCEMRYFRYISKEMQEFVTRSNIVIFEGGPEQPLQIHLALTGDPTEMRVMWVSGTDETPLVNFTMDSQSQRGTVVAGTSRTYKATDLCFLNGVFINPGYIHDVLLTGLEPSTTYHYSCGIEGHMSEMRSFKTAPPVGSDVSYKFIVYGDMGMSEAAHATAKYALRDVLDGYEFIFHHGDISYARGYAYIWDQWHALIEPYSSIVPYMVGIGNHEQDHLDYSGKDLSGVTGNGWHPWWGNYGDDSNGECGVPMYYRFHMPDNGNNLWWYSYDYGLVHFIMMSTEHDMGNGSRQYAWLEKDLQNVDRVKTPWVILAGHRPMYTSELPLGDIFVSLGMQHLFEDLLYKYHVDLALWAHYHSYERTCAVYKRYCVEDGVTHITIGTAGKSADVALYVKEEWSLFHRKDNPYGYGRVMVANRSALHWEYFVNSDDKVVDEIWLTKISSNDPLA